MVSMRLRKSGGANGRRSADLHQRRALFEDAPDAARGNFASGERREKSIGLSGFQRDEKPAGRLRVEKQIAKLLRNRRLEGHAVADELAIILEPAGIKAG